MICREYLDNLYAIFLPICLSNLYFSLLTYIYNCYSLIMNH